MVLSQDSVHVLLTLQLVLKNAQMSLAKGFFALFTKSKKKCEVGFALGVGGCSAESQPIHAGCSAGGRALAVLRRVAAALGTPRWQDFLLEQTYQQYSPAGSSLCRGRVVCRKG